MKRLFLFTLLMGAVMGNAITAQKFTTRTYPLRDFANISVGNSVKVIYTQGAKYKVQLKGRADWLKLMELTIQDGTLKVYTNKSKKFNNTKKEDQPDGEHIFILEVTAPCLKDIQVSGACAFESKSLTSDRISLNCNGAACFKVGTIDCNILNLNLSGASKMGIVNIACQKIQANISGANTTDIQHLKAKEVRFTTNGASDLTLSAEVKELLNVGLSGAGKVDLTFKGGSLRTDCNGGAKLKADVNCTSINASCDGASRIVFKGTADKVEIDRGSVAVNINTSQLNQF